MREPSLYLPSSEATNMDDSVLITREDLYRLSDGKIMSALLPKNSLVIDTVLGEGIVCSLSINVTHTYMYIMKMRDLPMPDENGFVVYIMFIL